LGAPGRAGRSAARGGKLRDIAGRPDIPKFKTARKSGYDRAEVDAYIADLHRQIAELELRPDPDDAVKHALKQLGEHVGGILQRAQQTAAQITEEAEREAERRRLSALAQVADEIRQARASVYELDVDADRIWAVRELILADARELANQLTAMIRAADARFGHDRQDEQGVSSGYVPEEEYVEAEVLEDDSYAAADGHDSANGHDSGYGHDSANGRGRGRDSGSHVLSGGGTDRLDGAGQR
jgi:cell division septum initiation protein DivIVA